MQVRSLGATGLQVSPIGLGLAALGRPGYINLGHAEDLEAEYDVDRMRRRAHTMLDAAWDAGVRYIDAARSYGRAEEFLASWLRSRGLSGRDRKQHPVVGSKWGYTYTAEWQVDADTHEVKEHSSENFRRQVALSRSHLGQALAVYQAHSVTLSSGALRDQALLDDLAALKNDGIVIGLSLSGPQQSETLAAALDIERDGVGLFQTVQATWNLLEPSVGTMLAEAHRAGLGVIVKEGVANGRLTPRGGDRGDITDMTDMTGITVVAERHGVGIDAVALAAVLANDWADVVLSGAATVEHLRSNLAAVKVDLSSDDRAGLAALAEAPEEYWARRSELEWS